MADVEETAGEARLRMIAHDLRCLLASASLAVEELALRSREPRALAVTARAALAIDRATGVLDACVGEAGPPMGGGVVALSDVVDEVFAIAGAADPASPAMRLTGDGWAPAEARIALFRILYNLVVNAVAAVGAAPGAAVELAAAQTPEGLRIDVRAGGAGAFAPAARRAPAPRPDPGDGLPIARELARTLGGRLTPLPAGAGFRVELPGWSAPGPRPLPCAAAAAEA